MTRAVIAGADPDGIGDALSDAGVEVARAEGTAARPALEEAGIIEADLLVVTDVGLATSIPVALDLNGDLRVVVYSRDSLPEFALAAADLILDPDLIAPGTVAEELAG